MRPQMFGQDSLTQKASIQQKLHSELIMCAALATSKDIERQRRAAANKMEMPQMAKVEELAVVQANA